MKRIRDAFGKEKAFIAFITCGDPDMETTKRLIKTIEEAGADLIELGIPFSDPTAEGTVIQEASKRALKAGTTTDGIFEMLASIKDEVSMPLVFMTYANVVFSYGVEKFLKKAREAGVCGLILPDVPYEEKDEFAPICRRHGIELVSLIAPTSRGRIQRIAKEAEGFIYCVSSLGVTGIRSSITTDALGMVKLAKEETDVPCAVGFGISTPRQAAEVAEYADGVIVGSAIVKLIAEHADAPERYVFEYVKSMKEALRR